ncbi:MAG: ankyrin repeat domain-containing protein [Gammaproteobacteria bacterium]
MKPVLPLLLGLFLSAPAWSNISQSMDEIEKLIRLRDYPQAASRLENLAEAGDPEAQYRLASLYRAGKGVRKDLVKATELHRKSALAGYADAQYSLGQLTEKADNSAESLNEAIAWYRKAAAQDHELAALKLKLLEDYIGLTEQGISRADIFNAIQRNDVVLINSWIANGTNLDVSDYLGNSTVMAALLAGWPRLANTLLEQTTHPAQINSLGFRPMHVATIRGYRTMVIALLDKEVDIDQTDARGNTALMLAAKNRKTDMLKLLLDRGANYGITNRKKQSAIDFVFAADYPAGQALLASYGIAPGTTGPGTVDPAATIQLAAASKLDQFKTVVEQRGGRYAGWPLLNIAIELGEIPITQEIIAEKPDLNATGPDGNSAIHVAARKGDSVTLKPLLANGVDINAINARNETALYLAVESDCLECVRLLLANKADPAIADKLKITPLEVAIRNEQTEIAAVLLKSPTSYAGIHRVLLLAIERNMEDLSLRLIKRDSRLGERDDKGRSALWHSADRGLIKTSVALIKSGKIDINSQDSTGHCALAQATRGGHLAVVHLLINADADLNIRTNAANTILMLAVLAKKPAIVELLMTRAIDINAQDNVGDTALMLAAATGQNELLEMLIKAGADLQLRNKEDLNAFQIANNSGHQETAEMIREKSNVLFKLFN